MTLINSVSDGLSVNWRDAGKERPVTDDRPMPELPPATVTADAPDAAPVAPAAAIEEGCAGPEAAPLQTLHGPRHFPAVDANAIRQAFEGGHYPYPRRLGRVVYEAEKARLQAELLKVQIWAQETGQKFVILMEGRDAAGKGGTIKRFMEHLNPRYARVVALTKPGERERGQCSFSATSNICRPRARSSFSTAAGITARASSG